MWLWIGLGVIAALMILAMLAKAVSSGSSHSTGGGLPKKEMPVLWYLR